MTIIYKATNRLNEKSYIGVTSHWPLRKRDHLRNAFVTKHPAYHTVFYRAIRKHGPNSFDWQILHHSSDPLHCLNVDEGKFIREYNTHYLDGFGYNMTYGGDGLTGYVYSQEHKDNMSKSKIGVPCSMERKLALSKPKPKVECPQCHKIGGVSAMARWHFSRCNT